MCYLMPKYDKIYSQLYGFKYYEIFMVFKVGILWIFP